jgi:hypothetical protein
MMKLVARQVLFALPGVALAVTLALIVTTIPAVTALARTASGATLSAGSGRAAGATAAARRAGPVPSSTAPVGTGTASGHGHVVKSAAASGWRVELRLTAGSQNALLAAITAVTATDAWAAGVASPSIGRQAHPLIERWNGKAWRPVVLPPKIASVWQKGFPFSAIGASSSSDFWAVSEVLGTWLHWNGHQWSSGRLPGNSAGSVVAISSVRVFSPSNVWAFGGHVTYTASDLATGPPYVAHFNGHGWKTEKAPPGGAAISAVSSLSPTDIWAVLGRLPLVSTRSAVTGNAVVHWNGYRWSTLRLPQAFTDSASLTSVLALSDHDLWIGGGIMNDQNGQTEAVANWNGDRWVATPLPASPSAVEYQLISMVADGSGGIWAVATNQGLFTSRLWHLQAGRWFGPKRLRPCRRACMLAGLARVPHTASVWAAGAIVRGQHGEGVVALTGPVPGHAAHAHPPVHRRHAVHHRGRAKRVRRKAAGLPQR